MIIKSSAGTEHVRAEYSITRDINGIPTLETEYFQPIHHHVDPIKVHIKDSDDVYIVVINESDTVVDSSRVKLTAVHSLIYDFTGSRIYEEITQHFSIEGILSIVFDDTDYDFEVAGDRSYPAMQFQNFGGARTRLELLNQICDRWECEYDLVGNMVYIKDKVGAKDTENKKFRYLMNINDSKVEFDITEGATYIKGYFGKQPDEDDEETENTYFELDYTHQLANQYGIRHAEPYSNENITTTETAEQYLKNRLENTWRLSIDIDVVELESSTNSEYFLGDVVWAIDERIDIDMQTRIIKIVKTYDIDDQLLSTNVTLGNKSFVDYVLGSSSGVSEFVTLEDLERETLTIEEEIVRKMAEFDNAFNLARDQMRAEYNQAYANALAEIEALDEKMATEIATEIANFEIEFNAEVQAAKDLAAQQIANTEQRINTTIDTTRTEMEQDYNLAVSDAREYAEQQAEQHANAVDSKLETMRGVHADLIQQNRDNIANVNEFIGDKTVGLNELLYNERIHMEERINSINTWHYNLLRETQTLDSEFWEASNGEIVRTDDVSYFKKTGTANVSTLRSKQEMFFEAGETYTLTFEVRTFGHRRMDYIWILNRDESVATGNYNLVARADEQNAQLIYFGSEYRRYFITFTMDYDFYGVIQIGGNALNNEIGHSEYRIRKPYLTQSDNRNWLYHPDDNTQSIEEITRRITQLEDGREEFITRTQYDFETGEIEGSIKSIIETVDESTLIMQNHENWITTNGSSIERTVDGFDSKVWLSDIHNPNMIPYSRFENEKSVEEWSGWNAPLRTQFWDEWLRVRHTSSGSNMGAISPRFPDKIIEGQTYTISWEAIFNVSEERVSRDFSYMYVTYANNSNRGIGLPTLIGTKDVIVSGAVLSVYQYELTFTAHHTDNASILFGTSVQSGQDNWFFMRHPKLEIGNRATPYYTAFSGLTQRVDEIGLLVQDIDGNVVKQSDITVSPSSVRIGSTEILGDDVLSSVLNVSPNAIDMITQKMRLSGDLYVDGDITALAISAVEGNFASLIVANLETNKLRARHINALAIGAEHLYVTNAMINKLIANSILTDEMTARSIDAIEGNFARLFASEISTVNLSASNITTGTLASARLRVDNALINRLIANSILTSEMRSQSLTAVRGDIADLRTRILTSDVITSNHISVNNALIDKMFASSALISRLTSKSAFISNVKAIEIDVENIIGNTSNFVRSNWNAINSNLEVTGARLRYTHSDGSYTQMSAAGLRKFDNNSWYTTHYLMDNINVTVNTGGGTGVQWVQLPDVYKGKNFKIFLSATDIYGAVQESDYYFNHLTLKRFVLIKSPDHNIDYANARVPIRGYAHYVDDRDKSRDSLFYPLQGVLTVIY